MKRLFGCTVSMIYKDEHGEQFVSSLIAESGEFWWNERKPDQPSLWNSKIELSEKFFNEIIRHPVPIDPHGPKQPDNQAHPPPFPRKQPSPSDRPAAVQGAKRRSVPLTARTDLESCSTRGKGIPHPFRQHPLLGGCSEPSAGINTDDSDPLGPDRGMSHSAAIGAGRNPLSGGGSYRLP